MIEEPIDPSIEPMDKIEEKHLITKIDRFLKN